MQQSGWALRHASAELKADREVVMVAVQQHGDALHSIRAATERRRGPGCFSASEPHR